MEYSSVPEKTTLFVGQMGKCMATCVPCAKPSSKYRLLECWGVKGCYSNLIELACFGEGAEEVSQRMLIIEAGVSI